MANNDTEVPTSSIFGTGFVWPEDARTVLQAYLDHKKLLPPLGPPQGPRHSPTVGSWGGAVSYERDTPVTPPPHCHTPK